MSTKTNAPDFGAQLVGLRRAIHRHPEVGLHLPRTQKVILEALGSLPLEISVGRDLSSVTAVLRGGVKGPAVLLRADMDGLPVTEAPGGEVRSEVDGVMHACGHDLHTAILIGTAHLLSESRAALAGDVIFMFQPGEELGQGARLMIAEGVLEAAGERPIAAYAMHVTSATIPTGVFAAKAGPMMSASDLLSVTVHGAGGHGSAPHLAQDPITVVSEVILAIQNLITRAFDVFDPVVVTTGKLQAGTTANVIPAAASFESTVRSFTPATRALLREKLPKLIKSIAHGHGLTADVDYVEQFPAMLNDPSEVDFLSRTVGASFGPAAYQLLNTPFTTSEDFSHVLNQIPGAFTMLGATGADLDPVTAAFNHSAHSRFNESVLTRGAQLFHQLATRRLAEHTSSPAEHEQLIS